MRLDWEEDSLHWIGTIIFCCAMMLIGGVSLGSYLARNDTVTANIPLKFPSKGCVAVLTAEAPIKAKPEAMLWYNRCTLEK